MHDETLRKGEATQARILDAAYALFMEQGYHGTSMRQIVARAGITTGGLYNHFASKEDIWEAVFLDRHPYRAIAPMLLATEGEHADEYVRNAAQRLIGELSQHKDLLHIMFIELVEFNGAHIPALYERIVPEIAPLLEVVHAKSSELRALPFPVLLRSFLGFFFSYYITEAMLPPAVRVLMGDGALDAFIDIYLRGVLAEEGARGEGQGAQIAATPPASLSVDSAMGAHR
jgi:AcrR family transcriptional regulator